MFTGAFLCKLGSEGKQLVKVDAFQVLRFASLADGGDLRIRKGEQRRIEPSAQEST